MSSSSPRHRDKLKLCSHRGTLAPGGLPAGAGRDALDFQRPQAVAPFLGYALRWLKAALAEARREATMTPKTAEVVDREAKNNNFRSRVSLPRWKRLGSVLLKTEGSRAITPGSAAQAARPLQYNVDFQWNC